MNFTILIPSLVWLTAFVTIAGLLYVLNRRNDASTDMQSSRRRMVLGLMMIGASSIPAAIEALSSGGNFGLAGLPLALAGIGVVFWKRKPVGVERYSEFTFREKSTAISLVLIVLLYGLGSIFAAANGGLHNVIAWHIPSTLAMMILMAVSHAILAIKHRPEAQDERDQSVAMRSARNGYTVLSIGVWLCLAMILLAPDIPAIALMIFGAFVLAEIVRMASTLLYSRFGI